MRPGGEHPNNDDGGDFLSFGSGIPVGCRQARFRRCVTEDFERLAAADSAEPKTL